MYKNHRVAIVGGIISTENKVVIKALTESKAYKPCEAPKKPAPAKPISSPEVEALITGANPQKVTTGLTTSNTLSAAELAAASRGNK